MEKNQENQNPDGINQNQENQLRETSTKIEISKNFLINLFIVLFGVVLILFEVVFIRNTDNSFGVIETTITTVTIILFVFLMLLLNNKRMMNLREELVGWWRSGLKALISGPMVSLYLTAAGGFIGYQITNWLDQQDVKIAGVVVKPKPIELDLSNKLREDISKISLIGYGDYMSRNITAINNSKEVLEKNYFDEESILKYYDLIISKKIGIQKKIDLLNNEPFSSNEDKVRFFEDELGEIISYIDNDKSRDDITKVYEKIGSSWEETFDTLKAIGFFAETKNSCISGLNSSQEFINSTLDNYIKEIEKGMNPQDGRDFQLEVIVTNEGGKQAVLRYRAMLLLDNNGQQKSMMKKVNLPIKTDDSDPDQKEQNSLSSNYVIVEPQGFSSLQLQMENDNIVNNQDEIDRVKKAYQLESKVWITLFDINNLPIGEYEFQLRDDMEADPNTRIKRIIKKHKSGNGES